MQQRKADYEVFSFTPQQSLTQSNTLDFSIVINRLNA